MGFDLNPDWGKIGLAVGTAGASLIPTAGVSVAQGQAAGKQMTAAQQQGVNQQQMQDYMDKKSAEAKQVAADALTQGQARGQSLFGAGSLGSVNAGRAQETSDFLARQKAMSNGLTPEQMNTIQQQNIGTLQQSNQGDTRALQAAQAQAGVRGPAAAAQQARMLQQQGQNMAGLQNQIAAQGIGAQERGMAAYGAGLNQAQQSELQRQQFNIAQANKEKFGQLATEMGYGQLGAAQQGSSMQNLIGMAQSQAAQNYAQNASQKK